ncbi:DUF481 domain-containing protein [Hydrogenimonas sp.]
MKKVLTILGVAGALVAADMEVGELKQHIEVGYLGTTGNSESRTFSGLYGNDYQYSERTDMHFKADAYYGEKEGEKTDERYRAYALANHHFDERWYTYAEAGFMRNPFEGYEQQYNGGLGMGYILLDDKKQLFKVRGGYQYRWADFTEEAVKDSHYLKLGANYNYHFSEKNSFESELNFLEDLESTKDFETVLRMALKLLIVDSLSLRVGFEVKYDNTPALDDDGNELHRTDTTTTVGIVYDF